jgi:aminopeptidase N
MIHLQKNKPFTFSLLMTIGLLVSSPPIFSQKREIFTHQDTLRGSLGPERIWWDVKRYDITVQPDFDTKTIRGKNTILFSGNNPAGHPLQIDLQKPMQIDSVSSGNRTCLWTRNKNVYFLSFEGESFDSTGNFITVYFSGKPREARNPPWDGGWIWKKDELGRPWISVACQGLGASVWFPCKDHQSDEPEEGASLTMVIPDTLNGVSNGRKVESHATEPGWNSTTWEVKNPINNYNLVPYIGKYVHWGEVFEGEKGALSCDFWVLDYEVEKAKKQFEQVPKMLHCFEHWFGPYPFYEDGYKLVQSPFLGMEHQSAVAYGNKFKNGYLGKDLSRSGWGLRWDYILIHESGHEWFGNNITTKDIADMWIHEGFTNYSETIYTACEFGSIAGNEYEIGLKKSILNDIPIIGPYGVNQQGSDDMYYKGSALIHILRQVIDDDEKFRQLLRGMNEVFWHQTVTSRQVENYISTSTKIDFSKVFDQYLRTIEIPVLEYKVEKKVFFARWSHCVSGFDLAIKMTDGRWIKPSEDWEPVAKKTKEFRVFRVDPNFYIRVKQIK